MIQPPIHLTIFINSHNFSSTTSLRHHSQQYSQYPSIQSGYLVEPKDAVRDSCCSQVHLINNSLFVRRPIRLQIKAKSMFRALLKNSFYFARRIKKTTPIQPIEQGEEAAPQSAPRGVRSEFKHMKELFSQMDKQGESKEEQNPDLDRTLEFLQKMIADDKKTEAKEAKAKSKVTVEEKLRKLGTPEHIIQKRQASTLPEQLNPKFTMQEIRNDSLVSQIIEQSGSTAEELANRTNRDLKLAQQELILQQIMKKSKQKEVKLDVEQTKDPESEQQYQKRLILRREKIIESLQQKQDPAEARLDWTTQDLLALKYSPEILAKARQYTNKQLMYFKELINDEESDNHNKSRLHKRHYRDQRDEEKSMQELTKYDGVTEPFIENSYLSIKQEQGLKVYEDDQFYKDKAAIQLREQERLTPEDLQLRASLEQDLELGEKISDVFLDESVFPQEAKIERRLAYSETSFAKQDQQIRDLTQRLDKLGIDFNGQEVKALSKQLLFEQKRFLEVQQGFQKYLQRKEKKKNMKKELRQAHKTVLRDDVDFQKEEEAVMSVKQVRQSSDTALLEDNFEKLREFQARKQAVLVQTTPEEKQSEVHRKKTFKNMENFLALYFANGLLNHNSGQLNEIDILQVIPNKCNTVMNIFWNISSDYLQKAGIIPGSNNYEEKFQKQKVKLENRLKNQANYISGKMTQLLRLRYGPEIRFHFDAKTKKTLDAIQELSKFTKEIAMVELEEYTNKGLIKNQQEELEYYEKLLNVARGKLDQFNSRKQLLSKNYQKFHKKQQQPPKTSIKQEKPEKVKNKRKNPVLQENFQISQERKPTQQGARKKKPSDKLWESIDLL